MAFQCIDEAEFSKLRDRGIAALLLEDDGGSERSYYHLRLENGREAVLCICKDADGLEPQFAVYEGNVFVGYGHCVDVLLCSTLRRTVHHVFDSPFFEFLDAPGRIIAIMEIDVAVLNSEGQLLKVQNLRDVVCGHRISNGTLLVSTMDGKETKITI